MPSIKKDAFSKHPWLRALLYVSPPDPMVPCLLVRIQVRRIGHSDGTRMHKRILVLDHGAAASGGSVAAPLVQRGTDTAFTI